MGWLIHDKRDPLPYGETRDSYLRGVCERLTPEATAAGYATHILASSFVGRTWYAAARIVRPATEKEPARDYVTAFVFLTCGSERGGFGYKDMTESMGPYECECPARILDMLTPIDGMPNPGYAAEWRERCRAKAAQRRETRQARPKPGDRLTLAKPLEFRNGMRISEFVIVPTPRRHRGLIGRDASGWLYRIPLAALTGATVAPA